MVKSTESSLLKQIKEFVIVDKPCQTWVINSVKHAISCWYRFFASVMHQRTKWIRFRFFLLSFYEIYLLFQVSYKARYFVFSWPKLFLFLQGLVASDLTHPALRQKPSLDSNLNKQIQNQTKNQSSYTA